MANIVIQSLLFTTSKVAVQQERAGWTQIDTWALSIQLGFLNLQNWYSHSCDRLVGVLSYSRKAGVFLVGYQDGD